MFIEKSPSGGAYLGVCTPAVGSGLLNCGKPSAFGFCAAATEGEGDEFAPTAGKGLPLGAWVAARTGE